MKKLKQVEEHFEEYIMGILLIGITVVMLMQIVMRMLKLSLPWAEELARYFYIWSVLLSLGYTIRTKSILRVDLLLNALPDVLQKAVELVLQLASCAFYLLMSYYSLRVLDGVKSSGQTTPALEWPMYLIYLILPVGFFLAALRSLQQGYWAIRSKKENEETKQTV